MPRCLADVVETSVMESQQVLSGMTPDMRESQGVWPKLLAELVDVLADHLEVHQQMVSEEAMAQAQDIIVVIAHHLGGRSIYLPKDEKLRRAIRDAAIYRAFDGSNHLELARRVGLTTAQIYNIISVQRRLRQDRSQVSLPGF